MVPVLIAVICAWCDHRAAAPRVSHGICAKHLGAIREALRRTGGEPARAQIEPRDGTGPDLDATPR
jgi:hypothetical protein